MLLCENILDACIGGQMDLDRDETLPTSTANAVLVGNDTSPASAVLKTLPCIY